LTLLKIQEKIILNKEIGKKWIKQALHDLEMAEKNIDIEG